MDGYPMREIVLVCTLTMALTACGGAGSGVATKSPASVQAPSVSPTPAVDVAEARQELCGELIRVRAAVSTLVKVKQQPTFHTIANAITKMKSEAGRLSVIADAYDTGGDPLKAADVREMGSGLDRTARAFNAIMKGNSAGTIPNMATLTRALLEGVNC